MQKHIIIKLFQISNKDSILKGAREAAIKKKKKKNYDRFLIKKKKKAKTMSKQHL